MQIKHRTQVPLYIMGHVKTLQSVIINNSKVDLSICVHKLGHVDLVLLRHSQPFLIWTTTVHSTPTSAPPHHLFWSHLCFCPSPLLLCHRRQVHPLPSQQL